MKRQPITVRLPPETYAKVEARAEAEHRSLANVVAAIVIDAWPEAPPQKSENSCTSIAD